MSQITTFKQSTPIPPGTYVETLTGNSGDAVPASSGGNINIVGTGTIDVVGNPGTNTLTISSTGITGITLEGDSGGVQGPASAFVISGGFTGLTFNGAADNLSLEGTLAIANGGTDTTSFVAYAPVVGGTTTTGPLQSASTGISNSGYVLTSTGASSIPTFQALGASEISITGDTGGTLTGNAFTFHGGTTGLSFGGSGTTETLTFAGITANGGTVSLATDATTSSLNIGTGSGDKSVLIGSNTGASSTSIQAGTGGINISTVTGGIIDIGNENGDFDIIIGTDFGVKTISIGSETTTSSTTIIGGAGPGPYPGVYIYVSSGNSIVIGQNAFDSQPNNVTLGSTNTTSETIIQSGSGGIFIPQFNPGALVTTTGGLLESVTGTTGYILTSNGTSANPTFQAAAASGITTLDGDSGSATGSTITLNANSNAGSSVSFTASGSTVDLKVTDSNLNTIIGSSAGNGSISGSDNTGAGQAIFNGLTSGNFNSGLGRGTLSALTTGSENTGIGYGSFDSLISGSFNTALGYDTGGNYSGAESSNILIGAAVLGTASESHVLRIGNGTGTSTGGNIGATYISGINGITVASADQVLLANSSNQISSIAHGTSGQVLTSAGSGANPTWSAPAASSISITGNSGGSLTGAAFTFSGGTTGLTFAGAGSTETLGGTLVVANGGTGAATFTAHGVLLGEGTSAFGVTAVGTTGQVLTGVTGADPVWAAPAGGGITTIDGDSGSATGSTITFNANSNSGSSVFFTASGSTVDLKVTDSNNNTIIGKSSGNGSISGSQNTGIGENCYNSLTSGSYNAALGQYCFVALTTGSSNCAVGQNILAACTSGIRNVGIGNDTMSGITTGNYNSAFGVQAASNYTGSESSNICIGYNTAGTVSESNVLRIGNGTGTGSGQLNSAYICGISGVNVGSVATVVTEASNQLGTAVLTAGTGISIVPTANTITISSSSSGFSWHDVTGGSATLAAENGYIADSASLTTFTMPTNNSLGDTIKIVGKGSGGWKIVYSALQNIIFGNVTSTTTTGNISSNNANDCLELVCTTASIAAPIFTVVSSIGNITVV